MRRTMARRHASTSLALLVAGTLAGCATAPRADLEAVAKRDLLVFNEEMPPAFVTRLAACRVVVVGEMHYTQQHHDFLSRLVPSLQTAGLRQVLFEWYQAHDWLFGAYVRGQVEEAEWTLPPRYAGDVLNSIRTLNQALGEADRVQAGCIDMNHGAQVFADSLRLLAPRIPQPPVIETLLKDYPAASSAQETRLRTFQAELQQSRDALVGVWGQAWYDTVVALVNTEIASIPLRDFWSSDQDRYYRQREDLVKSLVESQLATAHGSTLINVGSSHAQKTPQRGTSQEWLGDYLVHRSPLASGRTMTLAVISARGEALCGDETRTFDIARDADKDDLVRIMIEQANGRTVALFLDDPLFANERVKTTDACGEVVSYPKEVYDALVVLPQAYLMR